MGQGRETKTQMVRPRLGKSCSPDSQAPDACFCSFKRLLLCSFSSLPWSSLYNM